MKKTSKKSQSSKAARSVAATKSRSSQRVNRILRKFDAPNISDADFAELQQFFDLDEEERVARARKIIGETIIEGKKAPTIVFPYAVEASQTLLPGYATLDSR